MLRRGFQTLTHELGHTFGLKHCVFFSCLMQGANSLEEAEGRMPDLCPVCLRKLLWVTRSENATAVQARYERLLHFFSSQPAGFEKHLAWVQSRLGMSAETTTPRARPQNAAGSVAIDEAHDEAVPAVELATGALICEPCK